MSSLLQNQALVQTPLPTRKGRYFFVSMALLFFVITAIGFTPSYQGVSNGSVRLHWFAHVHGAIMTSWLVLFLIQSFLGARNNLKYHRRLGQFGFGLGVLVWLAMGTASVRARIELSPPLEDGIWDVLLVEVAAIILFGLFFSWGMLVRKQAAAHKRLLLLATLVLMGAGIDRTSWLPGLYSAFYVRFLYLDGLVAALFIYDWITIRRIHWVSKTGLLILIGLQTAVTLTVGSTAWHQFWYNRFKPYLTKPVDIQLTTVQSDPLLGNYGDQSWHLTVSREGDRLFLKLPDQPKWELKATADTALYVKTMIWKLTFTKGADGQVRQLTNTQGPSIWKVSKLK